MRIRRRREEMGAREKLIWIPVQTDKAG
jgi:hypothetical protein